MEITSLWYKILAARYGEVNGSITQGDKFNSVWWNNLISLRGGPSVGVGRWIDDNIVQEVGDDTQTLFWWDQWIDGVVFRSSFSRLLDLADNKWLRWLKCIF